MAYCTKQDLWDRFGEGEITQASDSHDNDGLENLEAITAAINDATDTINEYLALRYVLPLSCVPSSIKSICCDIARYLLHDNKATEEIAERYGYAIERLKLLADRKTSLYDAICGDVFVEATPNRVVVVSRKRVYTDDILARML